MDAGVRNLDLTIRDTIMFFRVAVTAKWVRGRHVITIRH